MTTYHEKRPEFTAFQFTGSEQSVIELRDMIGDVTMWTIRGSVDNETTTILFARAEGASVTMKLGEYLVLSRGGEAAEVLGEFAFCVRFERAA
jgi:hypothetical protein